MSLHLPRNYGKRPARFLVTAFCAALLLPMMSAEAYDLYWTTENGQIMAADIDGTNATEIFNGSTSSPQMSGSAGDIAVTASHIYWTGGTDQTIWRADRDGTNPALLIPNSGSDLQSIVINEEKEKIYFSDKGANLFMADLDGNNIISTSANATGIALVPSQEEGIPDELLVVNDSDNSLLRAMPEWYSVATETNVELPGETDSYGVAYNVETDILYYTSQSGNSLRSFNLDTKDSSKFWTPDMSQPMGVKQSPSGTHLLIAEKGRGISAYQLDTGGYALLIPATDVNSGVAVTVDPGNLTPPPPPADGSVLWSADFESDVLGDLPVADWTDVTTPEAGSGNVVQDSTNSFGFGTDNQYLQIDQANSLRLTSSPFKVSAEVATFSFDFIGHDKEGDGRWVNIFIQGEKGRAHITSLRLTGQQLRGSPGEPSYGANDTPIRIETIVNNSEETVSYQDQDGGSHLIAPRYSAAWAYDHTAQKWTLLAESYQYHRTLTDSETGPYIGEIYFLVDGSADSDTRTLDVDNLEVRMGASLSDLAGEVILPPAIPVPEEGEVLWTTDFESDALGSVPAVGWTNVSEPSRGTAQVVEDVNNDFGFGTDNQFFRVEQAAAMKPFSDKFWTPVDVLTLSFDFIGRFEEGDDRWLNMIIRADKKNVFITSLVMDGATLRGGTIGNVSYGVNDTPFRLETIVNNSARKITYQDPYGASRTLSSMLGAIWIFHYNTGTWELLAEGTYGRTLDIPGQFMDGIQFMVDGSKPDSAARSFDIDNLKVLYGAHLSKIGSGGSSFASWQQQEFPGETNDGIIGAAADPDGDGIENLLEYALGLSPNEAGREGLPNLDLQEFEVEGTTGNYLTLTYVKPNHVTDITYAVHGSSDLANWSDEAVLVESEANEDGTTTFVYRDVVPMDGNGRRFLHLDVSLPSAE